MQDFIFFGAAGLLCFPLFWSFEEGVRAKYIPLSVPLYLSPLFSMREEEQWMMWLRQCEPTPTGAGGRGDFVSLWSQVLSP